jgi:hypothetical protein
MARTLDDMFLIEDIMRGALQGALATDPVRKPRPRRRRFTLRGTS